MRRLATLVALLVAVMVLAPGTHRVAAQVADGLTLTLTPSATKAKIGDVIVFTVQVENAGTEPITGLVVSLGLPDALDAQTKSCPSDPNPDVTSCWIVDLGPGASVEVRFSVQVGSRNRATNGPVTAQVGYPPLAFVAIPAVKIIGSPTER